MLKINDKTKEAAWFVNCWASQAQHQPTKIRQAGGNKCLKVGWPDERSPTEEGLS